MQAPPTKRTRQPRLARSTRADLRVAPIRSDLPLPAASAHRWERPQFPPESSDVKITLALFSVCVSNYWFATGRWPWLCAPGSAGGIEVVL